MLDKLGAEKLMTEAALIIRGEHPNWKGDRIYNAEYWCNTLPPGKAKELAETLASDMPGWSTSTGLPPLRLQWFVYRLDPTKSPLTNYLESENGPTA